MHVRTPTLPDTPLARALMKQASKANVWLYRRSGGRLGGRFPGALRVCLLTTTGRKSGQARTTPLLFLPDGDRVVLVASQSGLPEHPQWYRNLVAEAAVRIQIGTRTTPMRARTADPDERAALWPRLVAGYNDFERYQARAAREIPVVVCEPTEEAPPA